MINNKAQPLLLIEDSDEDFEAFGRILRNSPISTSIYRCTNGDDALDFLYHTGKYTDSGTKAPRPAIILLDLNLPGTDGRELLREIKQDNTLKTIPVVVLTTSSNPKDITACYQRGANGYIIKPMNFDNLKQAIQMFIKYWFEISVLPDAAKR